MDDNDVVDEAEITPLQGPKRIRFDPVEYSNKTYDQMVLREPSIGALIEMRKQTDHIAQMAVLIARTSGLPPQVVHKLPQSVLEAANTYFEGFSSPSPEAGNS
jgi:hypothetical protein